MKFQNQPVSETLGNLTQFSYDSVGNLTSTTDPSGAVTQMTYNNNGQPLTVTDPLSNMTQFAYDGNGNLISTTDPLGNQTTRAYDAVSRLISVTDSLNRITSYGFDPLNRVTQIADANNGVTRFSYDPNGNLFSLTDANNHTTTYSYDNMDHLATRIDLLLRQESYTYDANGNLITFTDRKGQLTQYQYDLLQRRILTTYGDGSTVATTYDTVGRLNSINDSSTGMIQYGYDTLNRMIQETTPQGIITYNYDVLGRRTSMTANGQNPVSYGYDANSRLTTLTALSQTYSLTYDPAGRRKALSYPNGVTTSYTYDADSRVSNILHQAGISTIENIGYSYDQLSNRTAVTRANAMATNLPQALQAAYDAANEEIQVNSITPNLTYDANGNMTNDGTNTYTWNARNQLTGISGSVNATFSYDALRRRVSKTINGTRTDYQYDGNDIVAEISGGAVGATYVRSLNIDEPFARITSTTTEYYHTDALGSVLELTNDQGATTASYTYDPFGYTIQTGISSNPFQYTGRENDGTGLYYLRARYYSPTLQRFISEDPIGSAGGINQYVYAENSPLYWIDAFGLAPGDPYLSLDAAGMSAITDINPTSINQNREYGGNLYQNPNGTYSYTAPQKGGPAGVDINPAIPSGTIPTGDYHTHGAYDPLYDSENFSNDPNNPGDVQSNNASGLPGYLGTPSGAIKKYTPPSNGRPGTTDILQKGHVQKKRGKWNICGRK